MSDWTTPVSDVGRFLTRRQRIKSVYSKNRELGRPLHFGKRWRSCKLSMSLDVTHFSAAMIIVPRLSYCQENVVLVVHLSSTRSNRISCVVLTCLLIESLELILSKTSYFKDSKYSWYVNNILLIYPCKTILQNIIIKRKWTNSWINF